MKDDMYEKMARAIVDGQRREAERLAREAVEKKLDLLAVIQSGFVPGLQRVGELWARGDYFLPELMSAAESMKAAMAILQPELRRANVDTPSRGRVVIGTVEGDIHDIGKNLVASMLQAHGFEVHDLGADVKLQKFIDRAQETEADFICLSALLTTTMLGQRRLIEILGEARLRDCFLVLVGGAPVTQKWADDIGADGYAENALEAVKLATRLVERKKGNRP